MRLFLREYEPNDGLPPTDWWEEPLQQQALRSYFSRFGSQPEKGHPHGRDGETHR